MAAGIHSGGHNHVEYHKNIIGEPGKKEDVVRTYEVLMTDNRYTPEIIQVSSGETIRFIIRNEGELVHEFNIGTPDMHKAHQKEMMMMVDQGVIEADSINYERMKMKLPDGSTLDHNDPNSALLEPKKNQEIIWKFTNHNRIIFPKSHQELEHLASKGVAGFSDHSGSVGWILDHCFDRSRRIRRFEHVE